MSKILVTGGAGFIGSHIAAKFVELGHNVIVVDNLATGRAENVPAGARFHRMDVTSEEFARFVVAERPEVIDHHAAQTLVRVSVERPELDAQINVFGMLNLLRAAAEAGTRKVVFASSGGTVYGNCDRLPITEDEPFAPISPYGISKCTCEQYLRFFASKYGFTYTALRYANIFGPRDNVSSEHVITVFVNRLLQGEVPTIDWDGEQAKDYLYVADVVEANVLALDHGDNRAFNIGSGQAVSVNRIYNLIAEAMNVSIPPKRGPQRPGDVRLFYFDCSRAAAELGWRATVPFEDGLKMTLDAYADLRRWQTRV